MRIFRIRQFPAKILLLVLVVIIIAFNPRIAVWFKNFTFGILVGPLKAFSGVKTYFISRKNLSEENFELKQRLAMLSVELARTKDLPSENERLEALLGFKKNLRNKAIAARIIARDPTDWRRSMIIGKGKKDGMKERMPCVTADGVVGCVVEVGSGSSKVMLITDPDSRLGVVLESSGESGLLVGTPEGSCKVIYLSLDTGVKDGEKVVTAGFSSFFPEGLTIGTVKEVDVEKAKLYKYAIVTPAADLSKIKEVVCIDMER
ncbi:rod shape-determining protein MreC [Candidatus Omnitrophota bacterium]